MQGWSDGPGQAAQVDVCGTLTPHSLAISSALFTTTRLALQLEADFINGAISAAQSFISAALPAAGPRTVAASAAPRALDLPCMQPGTVPVLANTPVGLVLAACDGSGPAQRPDTATAPEAVPGARPVLAVPAAATAAQHAQRVTVAGLRVAPFAFSAPRRAPAASEVVGAAAADDVSPPGVLGRAVSSALAIAGISAANLTLPAFHGPQSPADPAAVMRLWGVRANASMRMVRPRTSSIVFP